MQEKILQILITFICQFSYRSSPLLLFINSSIFLHLKFIWFSQGFRTCDSQHSLSLGCWAFSLVSTFSPLWSAGGGRVLAWQHPLPKACTVHCPSSQCGPFHSPFLIQHGPKPWESTCLLPAPTASGAHDCTSSSPAPEGNHCLWHSFIFSHAFL